MHFKILKMLATSGFLTALECTKFVFGRGSAPDPAGGAYSAPPDPLAGSRGPTSKGKGMGEEGRGRGRKGTGKEKEGREGRERDRPPLSEIPGSAPGYENSITTGSQWRGEHNGDRWVLLIYRKHRQDLPTQNAWPLGPGQEWIESLYH